MGEWNLPNATPAYFGSLATDLDGVICEDCPSIVEGNENDYLNWIQNARHYLIPAHEVYAIVTCRLEKYRTLTEAWLKENNVKYQNLVMWNLPEKKLRTSAGFVQHKINALLRLKPVWYWESSIMEAIAIWEATKIPILCIDEMKMFC